MYQAKSGAISFTGEEVPKIKSCSQWPERHFGLEFLKSDDYFLKSEHFASGYNQARQQPY